MSTVRLKFFSTLHSQGYSSLKVSFSANLASRIPQSPPSQSSWSFPLDFLPSRSQRNESGPFTFSSVILHSITPFDKDITIC